MKARSLHVGTHERLDICGVQQVMLYSNAKGDLGDWSHAGRTGCQFLRIWVKAGERSLKEMARRPCSFLRDPASTSASAAITCVVAYPQDPHETASHKASSVSCIDRQPFSALQVRNAAGKLAYVHLAVNVNFRPS